MLEGNQNSPARDRSDWCIAAPAPPDGLVVMVSSAEPVVHRPRPQVAQGSDAVRWQDQLGMLALVANAIGVGPMAQAVVVPVVESVVVVMSPVEPNTECPFRLEDRSRGQLDSLRGSEVAEVPAATKRI